ncbi:uncharacterized protein IWZ02DRAFT_160961 [Phyllosticta citriasiana]|uniref:uncharacterized protein n=1 Tax=Phyllosticta citriasiana TaxID=595635 RepID=UPI0030FDA712
MSFESVPGLCLLSHPLSLTNFCQVILRKHLAEEAACVCCSDQTSASLSSFGLDSSSEVVFLSSSGLAIRKKLLDFPVPTLDLALHIYQALALIPFMSSAPKFSPSTPLHLGLSLSSDTICKAFSSILLIPPFSPSFLPPLSPPFSPSFCRPLRRPPAVLPPFFEAATYIACINAAAHTFNLLSVYILPSSPAEPLLLPTLLCQVYLSSLVLVVLAFIRDKLLPR